MPTRPVITPISFLKRCGTAGTLRAVAHAQRQHRADEGDQRHPRLRQADADDGEEDRGDQYITESDLTPPMRSATLPPIGRTSEPAKTQAAVKKPAIFGSRPYCVLK